MNKYASFLLLTVGLLLNLPALAANANPVVEMKTSLGILTIELYPEQSPKTVANFLQYARDGFYDGTIFHRVIDGFMIQGGGFEPGMKEKGTRAPIENESHNGLKNEAGTLAMARRNDPHSASAQFFINLVDNASLDYSGGNRWGYAVFGKITQGFEIAQTIARVPAGNAGFHQNVPTVPIKIESIRLVDNKPTPAKPAGKPAGTPGK